VWARNRRKVLPSARGFWNQIDKVIPREPFRKSETHGGRANVTITLDEVKKRLDIFLKGGV
jgi:hypothetical protein